VKHLYPDSIAGRTLIVLLVGLTLSHLASMAIYYSDRTEALASLGGSQIAERIATISRLVDGSDSHERERIIVAVNGPTLKVTRSRESLLPDAVEDEWRVRLMEQILVSHLGELEPGRLRVSYADAPAAGWPELSQTASPMSGAWPEMMRTHMQHMMGDVVLGRSFRVSFRLGDETWLNFAAPTTAVAPIWSLRLVLSIAVMAGTVIVLSMWIVGRLTAPLATFSRAAVRLGVDVNAPPLPETGPREVRRAVQAFNEMQQRIRRFIDDRTRMIAAISHDLRTPITRLRLRSEFIEDGEQRQKVLADLGEMEAMIGSVLSFARSEAVTEPRETLDLASLVQSVCDDLRDTGASVAFEHEGRLPLAGRPLALRRALTNVIENAVKYGDRARVSLIDSGADAVVRVDDDGPGIPESETERVFEPFYRLEPSRSRETGGAGLGLCVARTLIRAHGGDVALHNRKDGGLRVEMTIPREAEA
jgi:signal transduction histidine kinase